MNPTSNTSEPTPSDPCECDRAATPAIVDLSDYQAAGEILGVLAEPQRLAVADALRSRPRVLEELMHVLALTEQQARVDLDALEAARVISTNQRDGRTTYRLQDEHMRRVVATIMTLAMHADDDKRPQH
jgi:DNA-binding transcriptional ArsR family regulator